MARSKRRAIGTATLFWSTALSGSGWCAEAETSRRSALQIVFAGGPVGVLIVLVLLALSIYAAYLVIDHFLTIRRPVILPTDLEKNLSGPMQSGDIVTAEAICREEPSFLAYVILQGLAELDAGWNSAEKAMEEALADQAARLLRRIEYLSVIGNIAPMVGLLGTVTGMIFAFQRVANTQGAAGAGELAEGIYQALVTTVGGLLVAIPSLAAYAILRNRVDQLVAEAGNTIHHLFRPLRRRIASKSVRRDLHGGSRQKQ